MKSSEVNYNCMLSGEMIIKNKEIKSQLIFFLNRQEYLLSSIQKNVVCFFDETK